MTKDCLHCALMEAIVAFASQHPDGKGDVQLPAEYIAESLTRVALEITHMAGRQHRQSVFTTFLIALMNEAPQFGVEVTKMNLGEKTPDKSKLN